MIRPRWKEIRDLDSGDVYLSRLMLIRTKWFGLYVHVIRRADWSECQHDHPWSFVTMILKGGYEEQIGNVVVTRKPGYVGYRPRSFEHRISRLLNGNAVTLVMRFTNHEAWGFRTLNGEKVPWGKYVNWPKAVRVLWCNDKP
jgi:hypothetical protein